MIAVGNSTTISLATFVCNFFDEAWDFEVETIRSLSFLWRR